MLLSFLITCLLFFVWPFEIDAQEKTKVQLVDAGLMKGDNRQGLEINRFYENVVFEHEGTYMYCDSAVFYGYNNSLDAWGHVRFKNSDTLNLYGDMMKYDGNMRIARIKNNVRLIDNQTILYTDTLLFNRNNNTAYYLYGGRIVNDSNVLVSKTGTYIADNKLFQFRKQVKLTNPDYVLESDTLTYHTVSEIAYIYGPTTIVGEKRYIYAERGYYDTKNDITLLSRKAFAIDSSRKINADSIYYNRQLKTSWAKGNVHVHDTVEKVHLKGGHLIYDDSLRFAQLTIKPLVIWDGEKDTLYLHADTIFATLDSAQKVTRLKTFMHTKFYRSDIQGMCDSLIFTKTDSTITLYNEPVIWSEENQLTATEIRIYIRNQEPDSMLLTNTAFMIGRDKYDSTQFNQVKGRNMTGFFKDSELHLLKVDGNAETIYFVREEDGALFGINVANSSAMQIRLKEKEVKSISYYENVEGSMNPPGEIPENQLKLRDFKWLEERRPSKWDDVFVW